MVDRRQLVGRRTSEVYNLANELSVMSDKMRRALWDALDGYEATGVRFALCGGLAAGSYGEPRATKDIDFLVGDEFFIASSTGVVVYAHQFPLQAQGIVIDAVPLPLPVGSPRWEILNAELEHAEMDTSTGRPVPIVSAGGVAYMKLIAGRSKDLGDVVALLQSGAVHVSELEAMVQGDTELEHRLATLEREFGEP
jgi:hypothetical protein